MTDTITPVELIYTIYGEAVAISKQNRARLAEPSVGSEQWPDADTRRIRAGHLARIGTAAKAIPKLAMPAMRKYSRKAVENLVRSVESLAAWVPEYDTEGRITAESVDTLDELRRDARVKLIEVDELHASYPDPTARLLSIAKRVADVVLEPSMATVVKEWFAGLAEGDEAAD